MGVDSALVNTRTREYLDVRGFSRFTQDEVRTALGSQAGTRSLVETYTNRPGATAETDPYRAWLTDLLIDFAARGGASPADIILCHDNSYADDISWYDVIGVMPIVGSVHDFDPAEPTRLYPARLQRL